MRVKIDPDKLAKVVVAEFLGAIVKITEAYTFDYYMNYKTKCRFLDAISKEMEESGFADAIEGSLEREILKNKNIKFANRLLLRHE